MDASFSSSEKFKRLSTTKVSICPVEKATTLVSCSRCLLAGVPRVRSVGVKATCQLSCSPELPACVTCGLEAVSLVEDLLELLRRRRGRRRVLVEDVTGILSRPQFQGLKPGRRLFLLFSFLSSSLLLSEVGRLPPPSSGGVGVVESPASSWRSGGAAWSEEEAAGLSTTRPVLIVHLWFALADAYRWCSFHVFKLCACYVWVGCRDTRQKATGNLSYSSSDRLVVVFPSALCFQFLIMAEDGSCLSWIHVAFCRRVATGSLSPIGFGVSWLRVRSWYPGRRDLVATGWLSPSCSEGDTSVVVF
ncbi:hypothetical protein Taro_045569 [Colocasia esculenta]|uniref:Uncharacterized protein n=1 Tax=Colocasia esculenta TaxID=4460 RepID=A0A843X6M9_COLES|nr:hypothetical protein [Colocasia esculenta]